MGGQERNNQEAEFLAFPERVIDGLVAAYRKTQQSDFAYIAPPSGWSAETLGLVADNFDRLPRLNQTLIACLAEVQTAVVNEMVNPHWQASGKPNCPRAERYTSHLAKGENPLKIAVAESLFLLRRGFQDGSTDFQSLLTYAGEKVDGLALPPELVNFVQPVLEFFHLTPLISVATTPFGVEVLRLQGAKTLYPKKSGGYTENSKDPDRKTGPSDYCCP